jgi:hypothetical protein
VSTMSSSDLRVRKTTTPSVTSRLLVFALYRNACQGSVLVRCPVSRQENATNIYIKSFANLGQMSLDVILPGTSAKVFF